jgi:alkaline phosphatase
MKKLLFIFFLINIVQAFAQPKKYTAANAHSHNDYEQANPFYEAYTNGFGSIEADIFLHNDKLLVAHERKELNNIRSLQSLYLEPLKKAVEENKGFPYADRSKELQLLIDIKTDSIKTLDKLIEILKNYPLIINCNKIKIAISGNRPLPQKFDNYPAYIFFDGVLSKNYSSAALSKIVMLSDNFSNYSAWNGNDSLSENDKKVLIDVIAKAHALKKKVRFWNAPDNKNAWQTFMQLHVDYINTDHIKALATFLDAVEKNK